MGRLSNEIKEELLEQEGSEIPEETKEESQEEKTEEKEAAEEKKEETKEETEDKGGEEPGEKSEEKAPEKEEETEEKPEESAPPVFSVTEGDKTENLSLKELVDKYGNDLTITLKVDGEEVEETIEDLKKNNQLARVSHKRLQEANQKTKDAEAIYKLIEKEPFGALEQIFTHLEKGDYSRAEEKLFEKACQWLEPRIARANMSEDERRQYDEKRMLEREKRHLEAEKEKIRKEREERVAREAQEKFEEELKEALDKHKVPQDDKTLRRLAHYIKDEYLDLDIEATADQMVWSFKKERSKREAEWKAKAPPKDEQKSKEPSPEEKKRPKPSTPQFPSTPSGEGESPERREERARKPKYYSNLREFHDAVREDASR